MRSARTNLGRLSRRLGIVDEFTDILERRRRKTSDETRVALLAAMGFDGSSERKAEEALASLDREERTRILPSVQVASQGNRAAGQTVLRLPDEYSGTYRWRLELRKENGETSCRTGRISRGGSSRAVSIPLPRRLTPGYHSVHVEVSTPGRGGQSAEQALIVTPGKCFTLEEATRGKRGFGIWTNLYSVRSRRDWGAGDLTDLGKLCREAARNGACFVGFNPLHAILNKGHDISPYSPVSRIHRNPLYLDPVTIPEWSESTEARQLYSSPGFNERLETLRSQKVVAYQRVMELKLRVLEALYKTFEKRHGDERSRRGKQFKRYLATEGQNLIDFATFCSMEETLRRKGFTADWRAWPPQYRDPLSSEVRRFRERHERRIRFLCYLQFEMDRQLGQVENKARKAGLTIGLYQDLALGVSPSGSDTWSRPRLFAGNVRLGAPPDSYSRAGQNWDLPPVDPRRLRKDEYGYWRDVLRSTFHHSGAVRIDHIIGLRHQYWIPKGCSPVDGAYVRQPADDLLGILALESHRQKTIVIGEDLGTVPRGLQSLLARWGIISSRLLYFERSRRGTVKPTAGITNRALLCVHNHDLPPLAGYWSGADLRIRRKDGQFETNEAQDEARIDRLKWKQALLRRLRAEGLWSNVMDPNSFEDVFTSVHNFLCKTQAPIIGISLDDLARESSPVNLPGVPPERCGNWSRKMSRCLTGILRDPFTRKALRNFRENLQSGQWK